MTILLLGAQAFLLLLIVPRIVFLALVLSAACLRRVRGDGPEPQPGPHGPTRFAIVIPAHNEIGAVGVTVASCRAVNYDPKRFEVVVIADNCTDATAAEARAADALVVERSTTDRRSKGYALEDFFGGLGPATLSQIPEAYVLVDADTSVDPDLLRAFDEALRRGDDFIQGYYSVRNADASWRTRMMTYAFSLANGVWLLGLDGLGLSVGLKGNGMCFRASALHRQPWRAYGLVEDMEYAWHLRLAGERVRFRPAARVFGEMVSRGGAGAASQRVRWEAGRRELRDTFRRTLWQTERLRIVRKILYALDLDFPPLGRLVVLLALTTALGWAGWLLPLPATWGWLSLVMVGGSWLWFLGYIASPFAIIGLSPHFAVALLLAPYYIAWKATIGRSRKPDQWVRTPREANRED